MGLVQTNNLVKASTYKVCYYLFLSLRPKQWIKNTFIFAPLIFSRHLLEASLALRTLQTFVLFCLVSGAIYLLNDIADRERDRLHPRKRLRPVAAGLVSPWQAGVFALLLLILGLIWAFRLGWQVGSYTLAYAGQAMLYSLYLKHLVIIDVFLVALGFVLRVLTGASAIQVNVSAWLLASVTLLALFLALCKRRQELGCLEQAVKHRASLAEYSLPLLDQLITIVTSSTVVIYALYTSLGSENQYLMLTIPLVLFGLCRYLYLLHHHQGGGEPETLIFQDKPLGATIVLWVVACLFILYYGAT
ncbi:4-hydroxybenzoate polyprenyltransferase [Thermanaeromonas toyohensis ToBE]|uniref:4-hydroxybenzoate polyprenyltransferase n=1 Tax=Thermanaeromonas toyohensis ToBE TaxID=698762 RepID=A0A1W1W337_9FIRM|nr:decaprenyl-phosphate phosphoribosyltransferase [Thermanaeromonas toyohensis]SMB99514.1 4-hydroxybenzoate polyprenyltransferase [Thermanaeromonas toyohensis ToBE]